MTKVIQRLSRVIVDLKQAVDSCKPQSKDHVLNYDYSPHFYNRIFLIDYKQLVIQVILRLFSRLLWNYMCGKQAHLFDADLLLKGYIDDFRIPAWTKTDL